MQIKLPGVQVNPFPVKPERQTHWENEVKPLFTQFALGEHDCWVVVKTLLVQVKRVLQSLDR